MIISFGGSAGSGKSSLALKIAERLNYSYYDMGALRRHMALEQGITLAELNKKGETDPESDLIVDRYQENLGKTSDNFVITGRTSWHFIPHSLKIFLAVDVEEGARRIMADKNHQTQGEAFSSLEEAIQAQKERMESDKLRYEKYFQIDVYDKNNYDWYFDTTHLGKDEVFDAVWGFIQSKIIPK
ncbi:MAG: cytidylate kinase family protein [Candidatus Falkowbacteria bacterium]|nr:cytidylate kinase family protein [Candidatus Falkowbacteria bacterium]